MIKVWYNSIKRAIQVVREMEKCFNEFDKV